MTEQFIKISSFAELSGIPRKNLIEYDKKGILRPAYLDSDNQYRYYSYRQLDTAMIIKMLRELDMPLQEIKSYIERRSPSEFVQLCLQQKQIIQIKLNRLRQMQHVLDAHVSKSHEGMSVNEQDISLVECEEEFIFIGNQLPTSMVPLDLWSYFPDFLNKCKKSGIPTEYPTGLVIAKENLYHRNGQSIKYIYCKLPNDCPPDIATIKPCGLYVVGYNYQNYTFSNRDYSNLFNFIENNHLTITGDAYEYYLFDELSFSEPNKYLVKISIPVRHALPKN